LSQVYEHLPGHLDCDVLVSGYVARQTQGTFLRVRGRYPALFHPAVDNQPGCRQDSQQNQCDKSEA
jgi:hypothetical protein